MAKRSRDESPVEILAKILLVIFALIMIFYMMYKAAGD